MRQIVVLELVDPLQVELDVGLAKPKPDGAYGPGHRNVVLAPDEGMIILDVVAEEIACVEVLDRNDIRQKLDKVLP
jgi:hypothetical protein